MAYLFGDQLIWVMFAFGVAVWLSARIFFGASPGAPAILAAAFLLTAFMTDFALLLAQDIAISAGILGLVVLASRWLFGVPLQGAAVLVAFSWLVGMVIINAVQGSLNIFNPWV